MKRVLLAGGGTAGHTSPLLATADALRRRDPDVEITALGTARGLETRVDPGGGLPARAGPAGPAVAPARRRPAAHTGPAARGGAEAALEVLDRVQPDVVVGFGGYVSVPAYLAARRRHVPLVVHEGNALAGIANKLGARLTRFVATSFPDTAAAARRLRRAADPADDLHPRPAGAACARRRARLRARRRPADAAGHRRLAGRAAAQPVRGRPPRRAFAAAGVQVLHVVGPSGEVDVDPVAGLGPPYVVGAVRRPDGPRLRRRRRWSSAGPAPTPSPRCPAVGLPAVFVPLPDRQRRAGAQRPAGGRRRRRAARRRRGAHARVGARPPCPALLTDPTRLAAMSAAAVGRDPARRRREARRHGPETAARDGAR